MCNGNATAQSAPPLDPFFDRFDICAAYRRIEADYNVGGWLRERPSNVRRMESIGVQLARLQYQQTVGDGMTLNAWAIYRTLQTRYGFTSTTED